MQFEAMKLAQRAFAAPGQTGKEFVAADPFVVTDRKWDRVDEVDPGLLTVAAHQIDP